MYQKNNPETPQASMSKLLDQKEKELVAGLQQGPALDEYRLLKKVNQ